MCRTAIVLLVALGFGSLVGADEKEDQAKAEKLRKEIAELKAQIAAKEAELAKLDPPKQIEWKLGSLGELPLVKGGRYTALRVVAPGEVVVVLTNSAGNDEGLPILVKGVPTAGLRKLTTIELKGRFKVTGEFLYEGSSIWTVDFQK